MLKKRLFLTLLSTFLIVIISIGISFAWYTNKKVDDFESPDVTGYSTAAYYAGGDGSAEKPFLIKNSRHLYNFAWLQYLGTYNKIENGSVKQYYFEVIDDIDCEGLVLPPIGTTDNPFLGNFNGGNHTIENVTFSNNYNDLKKKPSSINSTTKFKGCEIIGFFGVVGKYADYLNVNISSQVNSVYDFTIDGVQINNACTNTLAGLIAGFVNGNISNVGVHYGKINLQAATSKISSFKNISSYTLIGDYDEDLVSWEDKPSSSNSSGSGADFGGTLNFPEIYQRMTYMDKYGYKDIWGSGNNRIYLDNTVTYKDNTDEVVVTTSHIYDNNYMPLVLENFKEDNYKKLAEETPLNTNIGYYVGGTGAVIEKIKVGEILEEPTNGTSAAYTLDASGNKTGVRLYTFDGNSHEEVTSIVDKSIRDILFDFTKNEYLYGIRFTSQIEIQNKKTTLNNSVFNGETVNNLIVPTNSIYFKASQTGIAKIIAYKTSGKDYNGDDVADTPNTTRALTLYRIFDGSYGRSQEIVKDAAYRNNVDWEDAFYYFEYPIVKGEEYAIGSSNGSDNAHFIYLDIGQNAGAGAPSVKPEIKDFAIDGIDFVYLNHSNNTFSSTSDDYSNVFFQISGTTTSIIDLFFRRNNDDDDNYAGSEGIVLFLPKNSLGEEWTTTSSGKTDGDLSLDWSYAGTKGLSGTSAKYPDETKCEVLSGNKVSGGLANTNTGVNTKRTITYYYRRKKEDGTYESVLITKGTVTNGYAITKPDFEVTGYLLGEKWYTDEALTQEYDFSKAVTENLVLYASVTEVETFTVTFMDGENELQTLVVNSGSYANPAIPRKEGYVFSHWEDSTGATVDLKNTAITADLVLKAKWEDAHDIKFVYNIGADDVVISTLEVIDDDQTKITKPEDPTLDGYNFAGWYTTKDYTTEFNFDEVPSGDTTIYAKFVAIQYYDVVFGYIDGETLVTIMQAKVEENTLVEQPEDPTRVGYVFGGWYSDSTCETEFDFSSEITANTTVYAKWQSSLVVSFEYEDGTSIESISVLSGNTITAISIVPSKDGYRFDGNWYVKASDGTISGTAFDFANPIEENTILVPGWIKTYEVTYVYNNDTQNTIETVDTGTVLTQPDDPIRSGYDFDGWYTNEECTEEFNFETAIESNTTIYAGWKEKAKYTVSFETNGGSVIADQLIIDGMNAVKPADPTLDGYIFAGWYKDNSYQTVFDFATPIEEATTIYAKWIEIYTITFDVNGGNGSFESAETDANGNITLPTTEPTLDGYVFQGWFTGTNFTTSTKVTENYKFTSDTTIYAGWKAAGKVSVTFDENGGVHTATSTVIAIDEGTAVTAISSPTYEGNVTFSHWSLTQGGEAYDFSTLVTEDITLYAVWSYEATVTFDAGDGTASESTMTVDSATGKLTSLPTAERTGYAFIEWNTSSDGTGNTVTTDMQFTSDTTVYAVWEEGERLNIIFNLNGDGATFADGSTTSLTVKANADGTVNLPTNPTRTGYIFSHWRTGKDQWNGNAVDGKTVFSQDTTVYAIWADTITMPVVCLDENSSTITNTTVIVMKGVSVNSIEAPMIDGYNFVGWYSNNGSEKLPFPTTFWNSYTIYAKYETKTYTVNFNTMCGFAIDNQTIKHGQLASKPLDPTRTGYVFAGWYLDEELTNEFDFESDTITSDITLYAKWKEAINVSITFIVDDETYQTVSGTTDLISFPEIPVKDGYKFVGWYDSDNNLYKDISAVESDITLYAHWEEQVGYNVTFDANGGVIGSETSVIIITNEDGTIDRPTQPTKEGYSFAGWYTDKTYNTLFKFSTEIDKDTTIYAKWLDNSEYDIIINVYLYGNSIDCGQSYDDYRNDTRDIVAFAYGMNSSTNSPTYAEIMSLLGGSIEGLEFESSCVRWGSWYENSSSDQNAWYFGDTYESWMKDNNLKALEIRFKETS